MNYTKNYFILKKMIHNGKKTQYVHLMYYITKSKLSTFLLYKNYLIKISQELADDKYITQSQFKEANKLINNRIHQETEHVNYFDLDKYIDHTKKKLKKNVAYIEELHLPFLLMPFLSNTQNKELFLIKKNDVSIEKTTKGLVVKITIDKKINHVYLSAYSTLYKKLYLEFSKNLKDNDILFLSNEDKHNKNKIINTKILNSLQKFLSPEAIIDLTNRNNSINLLREVYTNEDSFLKIL